MEIKQDLLGKLINGFLVWIRGIAKFPFILTRIEEDIAEVRRELSDPGVIRARYEFLRVTWEDEIGMLKARHERAMSDKDKEYASRLKSMIEQAETYKQNADRLAALSTGLSEQKDNLEQELKAYKIKVFSFESELARIRAGQKSKLVEALTVLPSGSSLSSSSWSFPWQKVPSPPKGIRPPIQQ